MYYFKLESINKGQTSRDGSSPEAFLSLKQSTKRRATAHFTSHAVLKMVLEPIYIFFPAEIVYTSC